MAGCNAADPRPQRGATVAEEVLLVRACIVRHYFHAPHPGQPQPLPDIAFEVECARSPKAQRSACVGCLGGEARHELGAYLVGGLGDAGPQHSGDPRRRGTQPDHRRDHVTPRAPFQPVRRADHARFRVRQQDRAAVGGEHPSRPGRSVTSASASGASALPQGRRPPAPWPTCTWRAVTSPPGAAPSAAARARWPRRVPAGRRCANRH